MNLTIAEIKAGIERFRNEYSEMRTFLRECGYVVLRTPTTVDQLQLDLACSLDRGIWLLPENHEIRHKSLWKIFLDVYGDYDPNDYHD